MQGEYKLLVEIKGRRKEFKTGSDTEKSAQIRQGRVKKVYRRASRSDAKRYGGAFCMRADNGIECVKSNGIYAEKKTIKYRERDEEKREEFQKEIEKASKEEVVYLDESGVDEFLYQDYGWSQRGQRIEAEISGKKFERFSVVAAKCGDKILAPLGYNGTCNTALFNFWLKEILLPTLEPGQIVVMDNASFHKSAETREIIEEAGCKLLYLPPYSPDLNPIEHFWANLKKKMRSVMRKFDKLIDCMQHCFDEFLAAS